MVGILSAMSGTGSRLVSNLSSPLYICMIYPSDRASLATAGSRVYGSLLVSVRIPFPAGMFVVVLEVAVGLLFGGILGVGVVVAPSDGDGILLAEGVDEVVVLECDRLQLLKTMLDSKITAKNI